MLFIEKIDDCNFKMYGDEVSRTGLKILGKSGLVAKAQKPAYNEVQGRISIFNSGKNEKLLNHKVVSGISLNGTVHVTAEAFVIAFNAMIAECCCGSVPVVNTTTEEQEITTTSTEAETTTTTSEEEVVTTTTEKPVTTTTEEPSMTTSTEEEVTTTSTEELALKLLFDAIANADLMIGGDSGDVADWNTFFDLPTNGTPFTSVSVNGNEVSLFGGAGITLRDSIFDDVDAYCDSLLSFIDTAGCVVAGGVSSFGDYVNQGPRNLVTVIVPAMVTAGDLCFVDTDTLVNVDFSSLVTAGDFCFSQCELINLNFPSLTTVGNYCFRSQGLGRPCELINLPVCTNLGNTTGYNEVFHAIYGQTITLTIPAALMTCNGGAPDGDITYLQANNTVTIITV